MLFVGYGNQRFRELWMPSRQGRDVLIAAGSTNGLAHATMRCGNVQVCCPRLLPLYVHLVQVCDRCSQCYPPTGRQ